MSTISARVAAAFKAVTGEDMVSPGSRIAVTPTHILEVRNVLDTRGHEVIARVAARDSLNIKYIATRRHEETNIEAMTRLLRDAEQGANALAALANVLGANSWYTRPILESSTCGGLTASKGSNEVKVYSNGEVRGYDDIAVRFARGAFEVALNVAQIF